jgi:uncharacterized protein YjbJ (UPF0337 family)
MNWSQFEGRWNDVKGQVKERWGRLSDDDLTRVEGKRDRLVGLIQQKYGIAKEKAEDEINDWATKAQGLMERAKEGMQQGFERARDTVQQGFQSVREGYETAQEKVVDAYDQSKRYLQQSSWGDMATDVRDLIGRHPLPAVLIGVGIGYMLGRMVSGVSNNRS